MVGDGARIALVLLLREKELVTVQCRIGSSGHFLLLARGRLLIDDEGPVKGEVTSARSTGRKR